MQSIQETLELIPRNPKPQSATTRFVSQELKKQRNVHVVHKYIFFRSQNKAENQLADRSTSSAASQTEQA